jgi:pantoate--beta-alanine ligase
MGALHNGHLSLVRLARTEADRVVASLFVNPSQFGPGEDFQAYPRDESRDAALLKQEGCDHLYAPPLNEIYPSGFATSVLVAGVSEGMEGRMRAGHFAGVATVVTKLLLQAAPDIAVFGEKDYQQLQLVRRLVADLDIPVRILAGPIVRDADGLALSSRNAYLTPAQRQIAPALYRALGVAAAEAAKGACAASVETAAIRTMLDRGFDAVDYVEIRAPDDLVRLGPGPVTTPARIIAAARLGRTRLLDNLAV